MGTEQRRISVPDSVYSLIPAQGKFWLLHIWDGGDQEAVVDAWPVIAWRVDCNDPGDLDVVAVAGHGFRADTAILDSAGVVTDLEGNQFELKDYVDLRCVELKVKRPADRGVVDRIVEHLTGKGGI